MNYFRDAIPPRVGTELTSQAWYLTVYCQLDLGILLPNLSRSVDYLSLAFTNLSNAGRKSNSPLYSNLVIGRSRLSSMSELYLQNQDIFEFADWSVRASKASVCED